ncbi:hypothetical protein ACFFP0_21165 [Rhizobium puerariae]|uniref:Uncharacterized protein n=1 Tax=Rhizobium puerariae TaxID=1585791 RepID=A0ABV6AL72_9HYPH
MFPKFLEGLPERIVEDEDVREDTMVLFGDTETFIAALIASFLLSAGFRLAENLAANVAELRAYGFNE